MHDTWAVRDLPVLDATVGLLEQSYMVTVTDIAARTGLDPTQVAKSLEALDPEYVDFRKTTTGGDPRFWYVFKVTPAARRAVSQWPTAESLIAALADQLYAASHQETGDERQSLLAYAARLIGDTLRDLAVDAAARVLAPALGDVTLPEPEPLPAPAQAVATRFNAEEAGREPLADQPGEVETQTPEAAKPEVAKPRWPTPRCAKPEVVASAAAKPDAANPEVVASAAAGSGQAKPAVSWSPPPWPDPPVPAPPAAATAATAAAGAGAGAGAAEPGPASPDLVPLPEPASFPPSFAGHRTTARRASASWPTGATAATEADGAGTDQNPAQAPGDTANAS